MYKIVIPYRNREEHLKLFAEKAVSFFEQNRRDYEIIIVEQERGRPFNLGKLTNIGFDIFKNKSGYREHDSFIFQPVDCIPIDAHYDAPKNGIAKLASHYATPRFLGEEAPPQGEPRVHGVPYFYKAFSIDPEAYEIANGFTNECWGWGGEDDDFFVRLEIKNIDVVHRLCLYEMLDHQLEDLGNHHLNMEESKRIKSDKNIYTSGLNTLEYSIRHRFDRYGFETYVCRV